MKKTILIKIAIIIVLIAGASFVAYNTGVYVGEQNILRTPPDLLINTEKDKPENVDFAIFWEAWRQLERHFLAQEKIDYKTMVYGAIQGMVASLKDPYTTFFTPAETKEFNDELSGKYEGVGMIIGVKNNQLTVVSPFKDSPAYNAGIKAGDKILKIDDRYTIDLSVEEAARLIRGQMDSEVKLLLERASWTEPKEFKVKRGVIKIPTLEWEILFPDGAENKESGIALIKIYQFNQILPQEFSRAAAKITDSPVKKIIVDVRNDPGGYLQVAQEIAGYFLERDKVVVWQDEGKGKEKTAYNSQGPSVFRNYQTVVLINEGSASASEILAGALRDQNGCKLIGQKSFGKGSVQEQVQLSDNSSLKITIAKWLTPSGNLIDENGLEPDIKVEIPAKTNGDGAEQLEGEDLELQKAIEFLQGLK